MEDPNSQRCPLCNEDMICVLDTDPVPELRAHWQCPEGDEWSSLVEPSAD